MNLINIERLTVIAPGSNNEEVLTLLTEILKGNKAIMDANTEVRGYVQQIQEQNAKNAEAVTAILTATEGITADIAELNRKLGEIPLGELTDETRELMTAALTDANTVAEKNTNLAIALRALDDQTPPVAPAVPVVG